MQEKHGGHREGKEIYVEMREAWKTIQCASCLKLSTLVTKLQQQKTKKMHAKERNQNVKD